MFACVTYSKDFVLEVVYCRLGILKCSCMVTCSKKKLNMRKHDDVHVVVVLKFGAKTF